MAKYVNTICIDETFNKIATATTETVCSQEPSTFSDIATYKLAATSLSSSDFSISAISGGRKVTIAAKNNINIDTSGTATYIVLDDGTNILVKTTCNSQSLTAGNTASIPAWDYTIDDPT